MKKYLIALVLLVIPSVGYAQITRGTTIYFDHSAADQAFVEKYQVCTAPINQTNCRDIAVQRVGTTVTLSFTLPAGMPNGVQDLAVRAVWKAPLTGNSDPSNVVTVVIVGNPNNFRITNP